MVPLGEPRTETKIYTCPGLQQRDNNVSGKKIDNVTWTYFDLGKGAHSTLLCIKIPW